MYIRTTTRRNRDGSTVRYLQLAQAERALFALVANRALAPSSKLATERWVAEEVVIPELPQVSVHHLYRAMDFLLAAEEEVQREVFFATSDLLNLEVDLLYFDTTSTYFELRGGGRRHGRPARVAQAGVQPRPSP